MFVGRADVGVGQEIEGASSGLVSVQCGRRDCSAARWSATSELKCTVLRMQKPANGFVLEQAVDQVRNNIRRPLCMHSVYKLQTFFRRTRTPVKSQQRCGKSGRNVGVCTACSESRSLT